MERIVTVHRLRQTTEPSPLWRLTAGEQHLEAAVPGVWTGLPGLADYQGETVYEKQLTCAGTLRFRFGGMGAAAVCSLDGAPLCRTDTALTPCEGIARDVDYGAHVLRIAMAPCPERPLRGILRPVVIEQLGGAYVADMQVTPRHQGRLWVVRLTVTVQSLDHEDRLIDVEAKAAGASVAWRKRRLTAGESLTLTASLPAPGVTAWSLTQPRLYDAEAVLWMDDTPCDDLCCRFGFRDAVDVSALHGVAYQAEAESFGCALPFALLLSEVSAMKAEGVQVLHLTRPADPVLLDLCDRVGMLVTGEGISGHVCAVTEAEISREAPYSER